MLSGELPDSFYAIAVEGHMDLSNYRFFGLFPDLQRWDQLRGFSIANNNFTNHLCEPGEPSLPRSSRIGLPHASRAKENG